LGCGPEQSADDRNQEQILTQYKQRQALLAPFEGNYKGTVTFTEGGDWLNVQLSLNQADAQVTNPGTLDTTKVPTLNGTLFVCTKSTNGDCSVVDQTIQITNASYNISNGVLTLLTTQNITNCSGSSTTFCSAITINLNWNSGNLNALKGLMNNAAMKDAALNLARQQ
jgi:hypothetical protein